MQLNSFQIRFYKFIYYHKVKFLYLPTFIYWVFLIVATSIPLDSMPEIGISDKLEHFGAYFVLAILFCLTLFLQEKFKELNKYYNVYSIVILTLYGFFDEVHQLFISGRFFDWNDLFANVTGIIIGVYLVRRLLILPVIKIQKEKF